MPLERACRLRREGIEQIGKIAFHVDNEHRYFRSDGFYDMDHYQSGLAAPSGAYNHAMCGEVMGGQLELEGVAAAIDGRVVMMDSFCQ